MIDVERMIAEIDRRCEHYERARRSTDTESIASVSALQGAINALTSLRDHLVSQRKEIVDSVTVETLQVGARYRVVYRLGGQRHDREMVAAFLGRDRNRLVFDLRPVYGTSMIDEGSVKKIELAQPGQPMYAGRKYEP